MLVSNIPAFSVLALKVDRFEANGAAPQTTFAASAAMLLIAVWAATGGRVNFIMYRLCTRFFALTVGAGR